jgi:hypothetical protein
VSTDLFALVRDKTTDDESWLPDSKIQMYLDFWVGDWRMAASDCLEYMARDDIYDQYARGDIRVTKPLLRERARELRHLATQADGGYSITESTLLRGDRAEGPDDPEYAIHHPPYTYGEGVMLKAKKDAGIVSS